MTFQVSDFKRKNLLNLNNNDNLSTRPTSITNFIQLVSLQLVDQP